MSRPTYALLTPDGRLEFKAGGDREMEAAVGGSFGAVDRAWLPADRLLRLVASDVALLFPEEFEVNEVGGLVVTLLGRPPQPWRGAIAVYQVDDPEMGFPVEMDAERRAIIERAHADARSALGFMGSSGEGGAR